MKQLVEIIGRSSITDQDNPLIAHSLQKQQYIGIIVIILALITIVGLLNRKFEYAIIFSILLSVVMVAWFFVL